MRILAGFVTSLEKRGTYTKTHAHTDYRTCIIVNGCYWNTLQESPAEAWMTCNSSAGIKTLPNKLIDDTIPILVVNSFRGRILLVICDIFLPIKRLKIAISEDIVM